MGKFNFPRGRPVGPKLISSHLTVHRQSYGGATSARGVALHDGRYLLIHGTGVHILDRVTNTWARNVLTLPRAYQGPSGAAIIHTTGQVHVAGGGTSDSGGTPHADAGIIDPVSLTYTAKASLPRPHMNHGMCALYNHAAGHTCISGGVTTGGNTTNAVSRYDPVNNTWGDLAYLPAVRATHSMCEIPGGPANQPRLMVLGGSSNWTTAVRMLSDNAWVAAASPANMETGSDNYWENHDMYVRGDGLMQIVGGKDYYGTADGTARRRPVYDPVANTWALGKGIHPPFKDDRQYRHYTGYFADTDSFLYGGGTTQSPSYVAHGETWESFYEGSKGIRRLRNV